MYLSSSRVATQASSRGRIRSLAVGLLQKQCRSGAPLAPTRHLPLGGLFGLVSEHFLAGKIHLRSPLGICCPG